MTAKPIVEAASAVRSMAPAMPEPPGPSKSSLSLEPGRCQEDGGLTASRYRRQPGRPREGRQGHCKPGAGAALAVLGCKAAGATKWTV